MVTMTIEERQRRERELHGRLRLLVAEGLTLNAMEQRSGLTRVELCRALARAGLPIPESSKSKSGRTIVRDVLRLFALWNDCELTIGDISNDLGVTPGAVMRAARRYTPGTKRGGGCGRSASRMDRARALPAACPKGSARHVREA